MLKVGIDDTDSERGLCTTYLAAVMMARLADLGRIVGLPKLVRLNPCVQFKTRGNAAVSFDIETDWPDDVIDVALRTVEELSDFSAPNTNPGLVVALEVPEDLEIFYRRALTEILELDYAHQVIESHDIWHKGFKNGRGLIGALAAVGSKFEDSTYELTIYREPNRWKTPREIDEASVWEADLLTYPTTWDTVDHHNRRVVFSPHSQDPVLFGIRGDDPSALEKALSIIKSEPWERKVLYMTNQGTDAHIQRMEISRVLDSRSYRLRGNVLEKPEAIVGGHLFFTIASENGEEGSIKCAAFEPTKNFRDVIRMLIPGDLVEVYGAVVKGCLNLEKIEVIKLAEREVYMAPKCPSCKRRMKSAGRNQGYRCRRCGTKSREMERRIQKRDLETGFYEVPPSARRHLAKPLVRMRESVVHPSR